MCVKRFHSSRLQTSRHFFRRVCQLCQSSSQRTGCHRTLQTSIREKSYRGSTLFKGNPQHFRGRSEIVERFGQVENSGIRFDRSGRQNVHNLARLRNIFAILAKNTRSDIGRLCDRDILCGCEIESSGKGLKYLCSVEASLPENGDTFCGFFGCEGSCCPQIHCQFCQILKGLFRLFVLSKKSQDGFCRRHLFFKICEGVHSGSTNRGQCSNNGSTSCRQFCLAVFPILPNSFHALLNILESGGRLVNDRDNEFDFLSHKIFLSWGVFFWFLISEECFLLENQDGVIIEVLRCLCQDI